MYIYIEIYMYKYIFMYLPYVKIVKKNGCRSSNLLGWFEEVRRISEIFTLRWSSGGGLPSVSFAGRFAEWTNLPRKIWGGSFGKFVGISRRFAEQSTFVGFSSRFVHSPNLPHSHLPQPYVIYLSKGCAWNGRVHSFNKIYSYLFYFTYCRCATGGKSWPRC